MLAQQWRLTLVNGDPGIHCNKTSHTLYLSQQQGPHLGPASHHTCAQAWPPDQSCLYHYQALPELAVLCEEVCKNRELWWQSRWYQTCHEPPLSLVYFPRQGAPRKAQEEPGVSSPQHDGSYATSSTKPWIARESPCSPTRLCIRYRAAQPPTSFL